MPTTKHPLTAAFPAGMSQPSIRALAHAGYTRLDQVAKATEAELAGLHGMGPKGITLLKAALTAKGLAFRAAKRAAIALLLLAGLVGGASAQGNADSAAVARVVASFHEALAKGDSTAALALLAPDAVILEAGGVESRADYRSGHLSSDIEYARAVPSKRGAVRVTVQGTTAWATSTSENQGQFNGRAVNSTGAELMVLTRSGTGWLIRAIHWSSRNRRS